MVIDMFFFGKSDIGKKRFENEDSFIAKQICENVWLCAVCDGMGGANGGQVASSLAVREFTDSLENALAPDIEESRYKGSEADIPALLALAVKKANTAVYERAKGESGLSGMGTTLTAAFIIGGTLYAVNVGDSRLYLKRGGKLYQVNEDHDYLNQLLDDVIDGRLTMAKAFGDRQKDSLAACIGKSDLSMFDYSKNGFALQDGDTLLLCSDGVYNALGHDELAQNIAGNPMADAERIKNLVQAKRVPHQDNNTLIIVTYN